MKMSKFNFLIFFWINLKFSFWKKKKLLFYLRILLIFLFQVQMFNLWLFLNSRKQTIWIIVLLNCFKTFQHTIFLKYVWKTRRNYYWLYNRSVKFLMEDYKNGIGVKWIYKGRKANGTMKTTGKGNKSEIE